MAKPLNKILKTIEYSKGAPLPGGEAKFVAKHKVEVTPDANGNDDDVFKADKVQYANRFPHHGYNHDEDHTVYEEAEDIEEGYSKSSVDKEIKKDKRIKGGEARKIHAILKGRQKTDEPVKEEVEQLDEERKESAKIADAFLAGKSAKAARSHTDGKAFYLHGNKIAWHGDDGEIHATLAGWGTPTTRERLNALSSRVGGKKFHQKGGVQHYGDDPIDANAKVKLRSKSVQESAGDAEFDAAYQQKLDAAYKGRTKQRDLIGVAPTGKDAEGQKKTEDLVKTFMSSRAATKSSGDEAIVSAAKNYMPPVSAKSATKGIEKPDHKPVGGGQNEFTTHLQNYAKTGDHAHYEKAKGVSASMYAQGLSDAHRYNGHHPEHHAQHKRDEKLAYQRRQQSLNSIHSIHNPKPGFFARVKKKLGFGEDSEVTDEEITNMLVETFLDGEEVEIPQYAFFEPIDEGLGEGPLLPTRQEIKDFHFGKKLKATGKAIGDDLKDKMGPPVKTAKTWMKKKKAEYQLKHMHEDTLEEGDVIQGNFGGKPKKLTGGTAEVHNFDSDEEKKDRFFKALTGKRPTPEQKAGWANMKKRED